MYRNVCFRINISRHHPLPSGQASYKMLCVNEWRHLNKLFSVYEASKKSSIVSVNGTNCKKYGEKLLGQVSNDAPLFYNDQTIGIPQSVIQIN